MVFQEVLRTGVKARSKVAAQHRLRIGIWVWVTLGLSLFVIYFATYGYVYNLSRVRHQLVKERNQQRDEFFIRQSRVEAMRSPMRIQRIAGALGMVPLTKPEAIANTQMMVAKRE